MPANALSTNKSLSPVMRSDVRVEHDLHDTGRPSPVALYLILRGAVAPSDVGLVGRFFHRMRDGFGDAFVEH